MNILDRRVPQPNDYDAYGVPDEIGAVVDGLLAERNDCPEAIVEVIDGAILRLLQPWIREPKIEELGPVSSIDVGFDVRMQRMPVALDLRPGVTYRITCDMRRDGATPTRTETVTGDAEALCLELVRRGYKVMAAKTPNGREIRATKEGFEVQPKNDNYWVKVSNLSQALVAYERPELYR